MKSREEILAEIELLVPFATAAEASRDRSIARALCSALHWVLNEFTCEADERVNRPSNQMGWMETNLEKLKSDLDGRPPTEKNLLEIIAKESERQNRET